MKKLIFILFFLFYLLNITSTNINSAENDFIKIIKTLAEKYNKTKYLKEYITLKELYAQIFVESKFNKNCVSYKGAIGVMQVMPATGKIYNVNECELFEIEKNIHAGIKHLDMLCKKHKNKKKALLEYFWGNQKQLNSYYYWRIMRESKKIKETTYNKKIVEYKQKSNAFVGILKSRKEN